MDIQTLKNKLIELDRTAQDIIKECGYSDISNTIEYVKWDLQNPDDFLLDDEIKGIMNVLSFIHYKLSYLQSPVIHEDILHYKKNGYELNGMHLHTDDRIEVFDMDEQTHNYKWKILYLTDSPIWDGMKARIREQNEEGA